MDFEARRRGSGMIRIMPLSFNRFAYVSKRPATRMGNFNAYD
jgi:hypothetical protein